MSNPPNRPHSLPGVPLLPPSSRTVQAARAHLTRRYARAVRAVLWEAHRLPLPDLDAVRMVLANAGARRPPSPKAAVPADTGRSAMDLSAALVVLQAARMDMDRLEVELLDTARRAGLDWAVIASILDLPDATAAEQRFEKLRPVMDAPVDRIPPPDLGSRDEP
ncbi:hypothetical protein [Actinomadura sediminis]|uniref:Uncharacterized protein n=1 Tax=Actinomadura sediminis TaxID=1038904 RepID=A0ABW3ETQ6_9ACTN